MTYDAFLFLTSIFLLACGSTLVFAAWPVRNPGTPATTFSTLTLGSVMVLMAGYELAVVMA